jgi:hypothetical protein
MAMLRDDDEPAGQKPALDWPTIPAERMIAVLKYRGMDGEAMLVAQKKSLKALVDASNVVAKGVEEMASRHAAMMQGAISRAANALPDLTKQRTLDEMARRNLDYSREQMEATLTNFQQMAELVWKCNRDAFDLVNRSLVESLQSFVKTMPIKPDDKG